MDPGFRAALVTGYERLGAWAELLDRINVFPVADGDTGRNLVASFAPLRRTDLPPGGLVRALLLGARGNSGNIGARFLEGFLGGESAAPLCERAARGRELARTAVAEPRPGTMLTVFDRLAEALGHASEPLEPVAADALLDDLERTVRETRDRLEPCRRAGVPDAGALGMFLFIDGFLARRLGRTDVLRDPVERFPEAAAFRPAAGVPAASGFCVDAVVRAAGLPDDALRSLGRSGESVVSLRRDDFVKVHLHAADRDALRRRLEQLGPVVRWSEDDLRRQSEEFARPPAAQAIHIVTDAAGSMSREVARRLGVTLLDSYISIGEASVPETLLEPDELYAAMRRGERVSTSQASVFERRQHYEKALRLHGRALYLCVGSAFTGNWATVREWQGAHDPDGRLVVLDTGAASGRLGLLARAVSRRAQSSSDGDEVVAFARRAVEACREWVFLDKLQWLAAGGRLSRSGAFFGDLLRVKPIISPLPEGARKVGTVRRAAEQLPFALARLAETLGPRGEGTVLLQHSDNRTRLEEEIVPVVRERFPGAELEVAPLSLTSGAHMGPGTWSAAALPPEL
ncbi:MAG: DegV family EDD domain-containing protein [Deltaproteobacteria bacterium]|nr:DegV family EDD domain-containing protein [Deltaproteobacteria bacterium]